MIVLDTSAAVELVLGLPGSRTVREHLDATGWTVAAPQLLIVEVLQVLRRRVAGGVTDLADAEVARSLFADLGVRCFGHELIADRVWELRSNLTAYDASFVALAELLGADLVTGDGRLAAAPGHHARIRLIS